MKGIGKIALGVLLSVFVLFMGEGGVAKAAPTHKLLQIDVVDEKVIAYFENGEMPEETAFQIAQTPCEKIDITGMEKQPFPYHTMILVDNSLSVTKENRARFLQMLKEYVQGKNEDELISLAVYGEDIRFLAERVSDTEELLAAVDAIDQQDRDTYLTDVMYELLDTLEAGELTRFIIISDGVDNKSIGITKEELMEKLKESRHQVHTVGHIYHENETQLENMFALSRMTNGREILLDEIGDGDMDAAVSKLRDVNHICRITVQIPQEMCDGSSKSVLFTFGENGESGEVRADIRMPFSIQEEEPKPEPEPIPEPEPEPKPAPEPVAEPVKSTGTGSLMITGGAVVILVLAVLFLLLKRGKRKDRSEKEKKKKADLPVLPKKEPAAFAMEQQEELTVMLTPETEARQQPVGGNYLLVLQDRKETERVFRFPLTNKVVVGRNVDKVNIAIDYNRTVSGQHCEIYIRGTRCYIRDLGSANKTRVDGCVISTETEIATGAVISLGTAEFVVQIQPV